MRTFIKVLFFVFIFSLLSLSFGEEVSAKSAEAKPAEQVFNFPYIGEITEDNVYIRSGPGTNYYPCGKVHTGDKVEIIGSQYSWSRIVPTKGSFSWISKQYVEVDPNLGNAGMVTGDSVLVYAGSEGQNPIYSTMKQIKLNTGEQVVIISSDEADYYKIVPPDGAYLWVSTQFTKGIGTIEAMGSMVERTEVQVPAKETEPVVEEVKPVVEKPAEPVKPAEPGKMKSYNVLKEKVEAEKLKPIIEQDYTALKKSLSVLSSDEQSGKAGKYANFTLEQIKRYELANEVEKAVRLQDAHFEQTKDAIATARAARLALVPQLGKYAVVGKFRKSSVFGPEAELRHYTVLNDEGKIACYALPVGSAGNINLDTFIGKQVGLLGSIEPFVQTKNSLVRFTDIDILE